MTSESTQPNQAAGADDFDAEMTMEEAMALEAAQRAAAAPAPAPAAEPDNPSARSSSR